MQMNKTKKPTSSPMIVPSSSWLSSSSSEEEEFMGEVKKGPWTPEEDLKLQSYISIHGHSCPWNSLALSAGLKRTGKSCRLRWLNYLRPDLRRGSFTLEEQLRILQLHLQWGNRWSKIAQRLPGRTDNEIKNYWRTRVQKLARQLRCDINSQQFRYTLQYEWIPMLAERSRAGPQSPMGQPITPGPISTSSAHFGDGPVGPYEMPAHEAHQICSVSDLSYQSESVSEGQQMVGLDIEDELVEALLSSGDMLDFPTLVDEPFVNV